VKKTIDDDESTMLSVFCSNKRIGLPDGMGWGLASFVWNLD
jgi:hypothetical protein